MCVCVRARVFKNKRWEGEEVGTEINLAEYLKLVREDRIKIWAFPCPPPPPSFFFRKGGEGGSVGK